MYPTWDNPLFLMVVNPTNNGVIPSMKNAKVPYLFRKNGRLHAGIRKSSEALAFERAAVDVLLPQWERSGFSTIPMPIRVGIVAEIFKVRAKESGVPVQDLDNQYTTLQETLQHAVPVLENDRQVALFLAIERDAASSKGQHARLWVWSLREGENPLSTLIDLTHAQKLGSSESLLNVHVIPEDIK
jgi:hypothetical protein